MPAGPASVTPGTDYLGRLARLIPGEAFAVYFFGEKILTPQHSWGDVVPAVTALIVVVAVRVFATRSPKHGIPIQWGGVLWPAVSFCIWLYAMGGPFQAHDFYWYGDVGAYVGFVWSIVLPLFYRGDDKPSGRASTSSNAPAAGD